MITFEGLMENFRFLILDVRGQVLATFDFLNEPNSALYDKIVARDDYIDNLKNIIENKCFSELLGGRKLQKGEINKVRSMHIVAVNLERIADFCVNIVRQVQYFRHFTFLHEFDYESHLLVIEEGLNHVLPAMEEHDVTLALEICRAENSLDKMYKLTFGHIMDRLQSTTRDVQDLVTVLFIFRYLERIGDSLLNIGEAILFAVIGEKIKIHQFQALQRNLSKSGFAGHLDEVDFQAIWGTRSGCRIGRVEKKDDHGLETATGSIFKEGTQAKIHGEKENLERWDALFPGLVPKVFSYSEDSVEGSASMLVEFLPGCTMDEVILSSESEILENACFILQETLASIWQSTLVPGPVRVNFISQLRDRLEAVLQVHPRIMREESVLNGTTIPSTVFLISSCRKLESELTAPFSIFIHGDMNCNNIVYDHGEQRVRYIDVYRSRMFDYVQDVSVFLVSNFRMPVFEAGLRERLETVMDSFLHFARAFAAEQKDSTFEVRLALAVARSLCTSTRFELDGSFARDMFNRAHYLFENLAALDGSGVHEYVFPDRVLRA
ncbi:MAG: PhoU family transcriptional regulator [Deltaproteobacteria bacterium]|nr:PhoU family transcriptional regulator [Deltaproteobacteria bacterium]